MTCETIRGEALQGVRNAAQYETHPGWRHTHDHILSLLTALVRSDYGTVYSVHSTREREMLFERICNNMYLFILLYSESDSC